MRQVSKKHAKRLREARPVRQEYLGWHPYCEAAMPERCSHRATDVHEKLTRARRGPIDDPDNFMALCRPCHDWITTHPTEATARGWMKSAYGP